MTRPANQPPEPTEPTGLEARLLDALSGELDAVDLAALDAATAREPALAAERRAWDMVARVERAAFEPAPGALDAEADRLAAWVRSTVRREETAATVRARRPAARGWTRVLAWSVGAHVLLLGILGLILQGQVGEETEQPIARVGVTDAPQPESLDRDFGDQIAAVQWRELLEDDLGAQLDGAALMEQERLPEELHRYLTDEPAGWGPPEHPLDVTVPMLRRKSAALKGRRLDLLGFDRDGTLGAVRRGLSVLALRQDAETGLFAGTPEHVVHNTALATLAFLGEGSASAGRTEPDRIVGRAIQALRARAQPGGAGVAPADVGVVTVALAEDYMLSYGSLTPHAAAARAAEIRALADVARARLADGGATADEAWLVWGLDAAQRSGVVAANANDRRRFDTWVAQADPQDAGPANAHEALEAGLALLYQERGARKPRFTAWSRAHGESLLQLLKPTGEARAGDPVSATATVVLALQVAYRAY